MADIQIYYRIAGYETFVTLSEMVKYYLGSPKSSCEMELVDTPQITLSSDEGSKIEVEPYSLLDVLCWLESVSWDVVRASSWVVLFLECRARLDIVSQRVTLSVYGPGETKWAESVTYPIEDFTFVRSISNGSGVLFASPVIGRIEIEQSEWGLAIRKFLDDAKALLRQIAALLSEGTSDSWAMHKTAQLRDFLRVTED